MLSMEHLHCPSPKLSSLLQAQPGCMWSPRVPPEPHGTDTGDAGKPGGNKKKSDFISGGKISWLMESNEHHRPGCHLPPAYFSCSYPWYLLWWHTGHPQHYILAMGSLLPSSSRRGQWGESFLWKHVSLIRPPIPSMEGHLTSTSTG